ncbi:MAG: trigger factor, partial [Spirochaetia bacterium]|nr:trigger factor [Spirochaetia bacterium]
DAEIDEEIKAMQERNAMVIEKKDNTVEKDNIVTIDYVEVGEDGKEIADTKRQDYVFTVGSGENLYKIDDEILGMKKDETKEITKKFKKDYEDTDLAGKTVKLNVTIKAVKVRDLPAIDDDFAQDCNEKYKTLADMKADIKRNMEVAKDRRIRELKNNSLLEQLVKKNPFDIPASMLAAELDGRWNMMAQQFQTTPEQLEKMIVASGQTKETMLKEWTGDSEKMLKSRIIVDALIRERNISVTPEEIEAQYTKIAEEGGMTVEEVKDHYKDARAKEYLIDDTKENKLYDEIYKEVKVTKGDKLTFKELFEQR